MYVTLINTFPDISSIWPWTFSQGHCGLKKFDFGKFEQGHKFLPAAIAANFFGFYKGPIQVYQNDLWLGHYDLAQDHQRSKSFALDNTVFDMSKPFSMSDKELRDWFLVSKDLRWPPPMTPETRSLWPSSWIVWAKVHFLHVFLWEKLLVPIQRLLHTGSNNWACM